uniref:LBH domain-containing protein n=1 Tax=Myripristis murdjan TaxID=586833 RepID=A0A667XU15_9TELE
PNMADLQCCGPIYIRFSLMQLIFVTNRCNHNCWQEVKIGPALYNCLLAFPLQIFPDPIEVVLGPDSSLNCLDHEHGKERLPSIVVEPTELSEVESGELRWPPESMDLEEDEEDLFLEQCIPPANIADWGDEEEEEEETSVILNHQQNSSLIDLQPDAFRDDTPVLPPSSTPALN